MKYAFLFAAGLSLTAGAALSDASAGDLPILFSIALSWGFLILDQLFTE